MSEDTGASLRYDDLPGGFFQEFSLEVLTFL